MVTKDEKEYGLSAIDFGLHIVSTENGYLVLSNERKEYPIGGIISELCNIDLPSIKNAILTCNGSFSCEIESDEASKAFYHLSGELTRRYGAVSSALIITEFLNILDDYRKAKEAGKMDEFIELNSRLSTNSVKEYIFEDTGYETIGFDSFGQFLLTSYLVITEYIVTSKYLFASVLEDDKFPETNIDLSAELIGFMCTDLIAMQHIDFRIIYLDDSFKRMYTMNSILSLTLFEIINCTEKTVEIKRCENCGKYFVPEGRKDAIYCYNTSPQNKDKTCREVGSQVARANKEKNDIVTKVYRKRYSAYKMKVRRHPGNIQYSKTLDELTDGMKKWRTKLKEGSATTEQFLEWINKY